jgi:hypothetical protein
MKYIKGIFGGALFGVISILTSWFVYNVLFINEVSQAALQWRPQDSWQVAILVPANHIFSGLLTSLGFAILYKGIPGNGIIKGFFFGLLLSIVIWLPAEIFWYTSSQISAALPLAGWLHHFITSIVGCSVIAAIYGKSLEKLS